ncbi:hypothetical protein BDQ94DRAFT_148702 [Aspergillus welwitschiae]|uniref:Uncharacterized protein n=1 Tax=Aspergillus welwitschiae TaxID=1341132 RepID=A0A3F3PUF0_9EURO|nr:hypothetical protein BDQ94DRAFT_148702 [Aspergillus welwitschiae]RDH30549.1 hypothetical protein BDQ94DRAFT_148702 [Aspergillus welwitschiae]
MTTKVLSEARTPLTSFHLMPSGPDALAMHILLVLFGVCVLCAVWPEPVLLRLFPLSPLRPPVLS